MESIASFLSPSTVFLDSKMTMVEAIERMKEKGAGAALILEGGKPIGIFTERDLLMKVDFSRPEVIGSILLRDVMCGELVSSDPQISYGAALALMNAHGFRHLPVIEDGKAIGCVSLRSLLGHYAVHLKTLLEEALSALTTAIGQRDPYTANHQQRVAAISVAIGKVLGMEGGDLDGLRMAALVHDVGKIRVPIELLAKPGRLTTAEFELIKQHSQAGFEILRSVEFEKPVAEIVLQHHERMDGSGYPRSLGGEEICWEARIVAVADVFEAILAIRPYRAALGREAARAEIATRRGSAFDRVVVDALMELFADPRSGMLSLFE